jgi:hypothetical protein
MKSKTFDTRIEPFMKLIEAVCYEENIKFLAHFDLDNGEIYQAGDSLLPITDIHNQIQHWEAKGIKLIPDIEEVKEQALKTTLANAKITFEREMDEIVLTIKSGRYTIRVEVTEEVLPLVKEIIK